MDESVDHLAIEKGGCAKRHVVESAAVTCDLNAGFEEFLNYNSIVATVRLDVTAVLPGDISICARFLSMTYLGGRDYV